MKIQTFEDYLKDICFKVNDSILDDDMPDFFDNWLGELDEEDLIKWADYYGKEMFLGGGLDALNKLSK